MNLLDFPYNIRNKKIRNAVFVIIGILTLIMSVWIIYKMIELI